MQTFDNLTPYVCVHYPGRVVNIERMIETLGGREALSEVICDDRRKPQLWFRPEDKLSKTVNGTRKQTCSLILKVIVKKRSKRIVSHEVTGYIAEEFSFHTLCDFQYLAMHNGVNVYHQVVPTSIDTEWLKNDGPIILVPPLMSRIDTVQNYHYVKDKMTDADEAPRVIASSRRKRFGLARFINFEDEEVPTGPKEMPTNVVRPVKSEEDMELIKRAFQERPIYSKTALAAVTGVTLASLKDLVPFAAYHFSNGPWRAMWVKFGYDPRTDPAAKVYQTLDFRIRTANDVNVQQKRVARSTAIPRMTKKHSTKDDTIPPNGHIFEPGKLPPFRVVFYQYCDVQVPEVQALLEAAEVRPICDILDGWLPEGTSFACRRIMNQYVKESAKFQSNDQSVEELSQQIDSDSSQSSQSESE